MILKIKKQNRITARWLLYAGDRIAEINSRIGWYEETNPAKVTRARKWSMLISDMCDKLPQEHLIVIIVRRELRQERKMDGWMDKALERFRSLSGKEITRWKFRRIWQEAVEATAREALERRLL